MADKEVPLKTKVYNWAKSKVGERVGDGSCFALVYEALRNSGAKTAYDYGKVTPKANYVWGKAINLIDVKPGDILQLRDHVIKIVKEMKVEASFPDGTTMESDSTDTRVLKRGHHSAIVAENHGKGVLTVLEQHIRTPGKSLESVQENLIYVADQTPKVEKAKDPYTLDLSLPVDVEKLKKLFKDPKFRSVINKYKKGKVKVKEGAKKTEIKVKGIIWAYTPEPK